jgi:hypothetical protein
MADRASSQYVAVRLDDATIARVDALVPTLSPPGYKGTPSDVLRTLIHEALARFEREAEGGPPDWRVSR